MCPVERSSTYFKDEDLYASIGSLAQLGETVNSKSEALARRTPLAWKPKAGFLAKPGWLSLENLF